MIVVKKRRDAVATVERAVREHSRGEATGKTHIEWRGSVIAIWGGSRMVRSCVWGGSTDYLGVVFGDSRRERKYSSSNSVDAVRDILTWFFGSEIEEGGEFEKLINQGIRQGEVVRLTPTRARLRYSMPKRGVIEGWHPVSQMFGRTLLTITDFAEVTFSNFPVTEYAYPEIVRLFDEGDTPAASVLDVWLDERVIITPHNQVNQGERIEFKWGGNHKWSRAAMDSPQAKNLMSKLSKEERQCVVNHLSTGRPTK